MKPVLFSQKILAFFLAAALGLSACAGGKPESAAFTRELLSKEEMADTLIQDENWWQGYADPNLNEYLELALKRNIDLAQSAVRIHSALVQAQRAGADLFPTASAEGGMSAGNSLKSGDTSHGYQASLGLAYELDLWGRLSHSASARQWEHEATIFDRETVRLALIHSVINGYYNLRYLQEGQEMLRQNMARYEQLLTLTRTKAELGKLAKVEVARAEQSLFSVQNQLSGLIAEEAAARQALADLLNCQAAELPPIATSSLLTQKSVPIDWRVPMAALAARPDLEAAEARFASAFHNVKSSRAAWYPSLTLGGALGAESSHSKTLFSLPFLSGNVGLSLPFLDWARVRANVKLSEDEYELARLDFISAVTSALNEVWAAYKASEESARSYELLAARLEREEAISAYYEARYQLGADELKDYLEALNTEDSTRLSVLQAKYALLRDESTVYRAMGGRFLAEAASSEPADR